MKDNINENFNIRFAKYDDAKIILQFIRELAEYEDLLDKVVATEESLADSIFNQKCAQVIIGEYKGQPVGLALFFQNFSTFLGKKGLYLEDLYIRPEVRGKGFGKTMLSFLANVAKETDCGRLEWACLDDNTPSYEFYKSLGARPMDEWTVFRLTGESLNKLSEYNK